MSKQLCTEQNLKRCLALHILTTLNVAGKVLIFPQHSFFLHTQKLLATIPTDPYICASLASGNKQVVGITSRICLRIEIKWPLGKHLKRNKCENFGFTQQQQQQQILDEFFFHMNVKWAYLKCNSQFWVKSKNDIKFVRQVEFEGEDGKKKKRNKKTQPKIFKVSHFWCTAMNWTIALNIKWKWIISEVSICHNYFDRFSNCNSFETN